MADDYTIKHTKPNSRQMLTDYRMMFSGSNLKFLFVMIIPTVIVSFIYVWGPSANNENLILSSVAVLNGFFMLGWLPMVSLRLLSPLWVRLLGPIVIGLLEIVRMLLYGIQFFVDRLLIESVEKSFLYPDHNA